MSALSQALKVFGRIASIATLLTVQARAAGISATATYTAALNGTTPSLYDYSLTLINTGTTSVGTFWFPSALPQAGQSLPGFNFSSTETPEQLLGLVPSGIGSGEPITTSFVYIDAPFGDPGQQFVATAATPKPGSLMLLATGLMGGAGVSSDYINKEALRYRIAAETQGRHTFMPVVWWSNRRRNDRGSSPCPAADVKSFESLDSIGV